MNSKKTTFNIMFGLAILFFLFSMTLLFITVKQYYFEKKESEIKKELVLQKDDPYFDVIKYSPILHEELKKYNLEKYTITLTALMYQESRGKGGDPMQSSESVGLAPNSIEDPKKSIKYGVKHFNRVFRYGQEKKVDFSTIIQAYNMGMGYISYIADHGRNHSEQLAKKFSLIQVKKNPTVYNCSGDKDNFRYPYCYGDFSYNGKVAKNIEVLSESVPASENKETASEDF